MFPRLVGMVFKPHFVTSKETLLPLRMFEQVAMYCRSYVNAIPVTFVLGFYVSLVVTRWWGQFQTLPWPDNLAILVSNSIQGRVS